MFEKMRHLKDATKVGLCWTRACDLVSKKRYVEALGYIEKIEEITDSLPDVALMKGLIYLRLEKYEDCTSIVLEAVEKISQYKKYTNSDKLYLKAFAALCYQRATKSLGREDTSTLEFAAQDVALENVNPEFKKIFPIRNVGGTQS